MARNLQVECANSTMHLAKILRTQSIYTLSSTYRKIPNRLCTRSLAPCCLFIFALCFLIGCKNHTVDVETYLPKPEWVDTIAAPLLSNVDEVKQLWSSKKRCCINKRKLKSNQREFYKACYVAVANHSDDDQLVAKCLQLMDNGMEPSVTHRINTLFLDRYFDFKSPIDRCSNCLPADPIANASRDLAYLEFRSHDLAKAIKTVQRVLDVRLEEISPFVQMNLYAALAQFYAKAGYTQSQLDALRAARDRLQVHVKSKGASKYNFETFVRNLGDLLES